MPSKSTRRLLQLLRCARQKIEKLFIEQCARGQQTTNLDDATAAACGQFIGPDAKELSQRGLHGTAAALKVLCQTDEDDARSLVKQLVKYLSEREAVEQQVNDSDEARVVRVSYKCDLDRHNVIKLAETLEALAYAQHAGADVSTQLSEIRNSLTANVRDDKGWYYFTEEDRPPEILPTAYAMLALAEAGSYEEANRAEKYLTEELAGYYQPGANNVPDSQTRAVHIACLYAVTFRKRPNGEGDSDTLAAVFHSLWRRCERELDHDEEQNVEYWRELSKTCYVRVPWQLYLLALAARYNFRWSFSRSLAQTLLNRLAQETRLHGFIYPHSGQRPSARTNAIVHEVLGHLIDVLQHRNLAVLPRACEVVCRIAHSRLAGAVYCGVAILVIVYSGYRAISGDQAMWSQLAYGFLGAIVMILLSAGIRGLKRPTQP